MIRPQLPLTLADSEPEPDLAVVPTREEDAARRHPSSALLVIEISDSSVRHDLKVKARIYAKAGIPEYWVVDVQQRRIVVLRDPETAAGAYRTELTVSGDSSVTPIAPPGPVVHVADLFD
jgi:Uma2 family endonuclease